MDTFKREKAIANKLVRQRADNSAAILFVHGLGGRAGDWSKFVRVLKDDWMLREFDYILWEYPTLRGPIGWIKQGLQPSTSLAPKIEDVARNLATFIDQNLFQYQRLIFVAHSMGGLIVRRYLVDEAERRAGVDRIALLTLYATPNDGVEVVRVLGPLARLNSQLSGLRAGEALVQGLQEGWDRAGLSTSIPAVLVCGLQDRLVPCESVEAMASQSTNRAVTVRGNHSNCIRPRAGNGESYTAFRESAKGGKDFSELPALLATGDFGAVQRLAGVAPTRAQETLQCVAQFAGSSTPGYARWTRSTGRRRHI